MLLSGVARFEHLAGDFQKPVAITRGIQCDFMGSSTVHGSFKNHSITFVPKWHPVTGRLLISGQEFLVSLRLRALNTSTRHSI